MYNLKLKKVIFTGKVAENLWEYFQYWGKLFDDKYFVEFERNIDDLSRTVTVRNVPNEDAKSFVDNAPDDMKKYVRIESEEE